MLYVIDYNVFRGGKMMGQELTNNSGVYIMRVASMLTGMHPQTLRKYERAGLLEPSRNKKLRMYSEEDIARLKTIKHLVDDVGLNIAGVKIALKIYDLVLNIRKQLQSTDLNSEKRKYLVDSLDEGLRTLGAFSSPSKEKLVSQVNQPSRA
jgi:MerR family transcriptional regulator, heat shock protein HspR